MTVGRFLKNIRARLGLFTSASAFYHYLETRAELDFNYSYYMRIEAGQAIPSAKWFNHMCAVLPKGFEDSLVLTYCSPNFPTRRHLFKQEHVAPVIALDKKGVRPSVLTEERHTNLTQRELTERQIAAISKSQEHYFVFLILSLAGGSLRKQSLKTTSQK